MLEESSVRQSQTDHHNTPVDFTVVVPNATRDVDSESAPIAQFENPSQRTERGNPPSSGERDPQVSGMESLVEQERAGNISATVACLITGARSSATRKGYLSCWKKFSGWCSKRQVDPATADLKFVLDFLAELFDKRLEYSTLNGYRSALSLYHVPIQGMKAGQHPLVTSLMKGVSNARPPIPKYRYVWDVEVVLRFMRSLGDNGSLDIKTLSWKVATLLGLCNIPRSQELSALDVKFMSKSNGSYVCGFGVSVKHRRKGKPVPTVSFYQFLPDSNLCPVLALDAYIQRTEDFRASANTTQLFLAVNRPHKPVSRSTLARWVVNTLSLAGVDTSKFKGHSVRSASSSKVKSAGISLGDVLKMGNWSSESVWQKHYHKPIETPHQRYQQALLGTAL